MYLLVKRCVAVAHVHRLLFTTRFFAFTKFSIVTWMSTQFVIQQLFTSSNVY